MNIVFRVLNVLFCSYAGAGFLWFINFNTVFCFAL